MLFRSLDVLWTQASGAGAVLAYSFVVTIVLALVLKFTVGLRIGKDDEQGGIDKAVHAESAYELGESGGGGVFAGIGGFGSARNSTEVE